MKQRMLTTLLAGLLLCAGGLTASAALVVLTHGQTHIGHTVARSERAITLRAANGKLYQFPVYLVHRVQVFPPTTSVQIAAVAGRLYAEPDVESTVRSNVYPGTEFVVEASREAWLQVRGVGRRDRGWLPRAGVAEQVLLRELDDEVEEPDVDELLKMYRDVYDPQTGKGRVLQEVNNVE